MEVLKLKIAQLRKRKGMTQQELGARLGISYQSVSKWENHQTMPDITLLPALSEIFGVSVDQLLGLKPLSDDYQAADSGKKEYWSKKSRFLLHSRKLFWNTDYLEFLVNHVWKLREPVNLLDCGCGYGFLGLILLPLLPAGSTYTGIDFSDDLLELGKELFAREGLQGEFLAADLYETELVRRFDLVVSQAVLRHVDDGAAFLEKMVGYARPGGLVISIETNRELEAAGLYIDGMDYGQLCAHEGLKKLWLREYGMQGRDYSIAMKVPHLMSRSGLTDVEVRMNDRVTYLEPGQVGYLDACSDLMKAYHWDRYKTADEVERELPYLMNHGMSRREAEDFCRRQNEVAVWLQEHEGSAALTVAGGMMIAFGRR